MSSEGNVKNEVCQHGSSCCVRHDFKGQVGSSSRKQDINQVLRPEYEHTCTESHCLSLCVCTYLKANAHQLKATNEFQIMICQFLSQDTYYKQFRYKKMGLKWNIQGPFSYNGKKVEIRIFKQIFSKSGKQRGFYKNQWTAKRKWQKATNDILNS